MKTHTILYLLLGSLPLAGGTSIVAHRGASADAPENTLPAFALAWERGADAIEGDFHLSSDGHIVCIHDQDTKRVAGRKLVVKDTPLAELRKLDVGSWKGQEWKGARIPILSEVLATVPAGKRVFIEVKCGPEIVPAMLRDIGASGLEAGQVTVISFQAEVIAGLKKRTRQYRAFWLSSFGKNRASPLEPSAASVLATLQRVGADGFSSKADPRIDARYIRAIVGRGYSYHVWTVDEPELARRFSRLGVSSITTNRPAFIRAALARGGG